MIQRIKIGDEIGGKFKVHKILGGEKESGMGIVYICSHKDYHGVFALKTYQDRYIYSDEIKESFRQEALAWISLDKHPYIVNAFSFDILEERPFIFLELIIWDDKGRNNLQHYIESDFAPSAQLFKLLFDDLYPETSEDMTNEIKEKIQLKVLDWAIQFCHGMEHAISHNISPHRDIKPDNILITKDGILKITDFGLAKIWDESNFTIVNSHAINESCFRFFENGKGKIYTGSPPWMAPENFEGHADVKSDIYSWGIVLYQMINGGIPPFDAENYKGWCEAHQKEKVPPIDYKIFPIIAKCLEKNPEDRYQDFKELRHDLECLYIDEKGHLPQKPPEKEELKAWELVNKAYALEKLGFKDDAILELKKAKERDIQFIPARINLGTSFIRRGKYEDAIVEFKDINHISPKNSESHYNLAIAYYENHKIDKAITEYENAIKFNPKCKEAHVNLGNILKDNGNIDEAIAEYNKAIEIDGTFFKGIASLANALRERGLYDDAIKQFEKAKKINPDDAALYNNWGLTLMDNGDNKGAILKFVRAITLNPDYSEAHNNLALSFKAKGDIDKAIFEFKLAYEANPYNSGAHSNLGILYAETGYFAAAIDEFNEALRIEPDRINFKINLGHALLDNRQYDESISLFTEILLFSPENSEIHLLKGLAFAKKGELNEAISEFEEALRISPENEGAKINLRIAKNQKSQNNDSA